MDSSNNSRSVGGNSRFIFIGDVHGCVHELKKLIQLVRPTAQDQLIMLGDLIHKGPHGLQVLRFCQMLQRVTNFTLITGNHEEKHLRWLTREKECAATGKKNRMEHVEEFPQLLLKPKDVEFLENSHLIKQFVDDHGQVYTAVHAGISPDKPDAKDMTYKQWLGLSSKKKGNTGRVLRVRFLNEDLKQVSMSQEQPSDKYWAELYDGRFGKVIFGHNVFLQHSPKVFKHAYGIDLGCVHGGHLCALVIDKRTSQRKTFLVKAEQMYKEKLHKDKK